MKNFHFQCGILSQLGKINSHGKRSEAIFDAELLQKTGHERIVFLFETILGEIYGTSNQIEIIQIKK